MNLLRCSLAITAVVLGGAAPSPAQNVIFHAQLDEYTAYANIWGYTDPQGREYALLGATTGLSVVNLEDPANPYETGFIPGVTSTWREIASYSHYAYVVTEGGGGLDIIDLADPENPVGLPNYTGFDTAHTIRIDEATARCFINGSNLVNGGIRVLSLANPTAPVEIGSWEVRYVHDCYKDGNRLYAACIFDARLDILNATNPSPVVTPLATISNYPNAFTHNAWTTADHDYVMTCDETSGSSVRLWDVSNLPSTPETDSYRANPTAPIPHNVHIDGELAYVSHYTLGVKILDVTDRFNIGEIASYDTYPPNNGGTFDGCWGVFPFFGTNPDLFVLSDIQGGLFVMEFDPNSGGVAGEVTKSGEPATKIAGATVQVLGGTSVTTNALGQYLLIAESGAQTLEVSAFGYVTQQVPVNVVTSDTVTVNVALVPVPGGSIDGEVTNANTAAPIAGAKVEIQTTPLVVFTDAQGAYDHPAVPTGVYTVKASAFGFNAKQANVNVLPGSQLGIDFPLSPATIVTSFESGVGLWSVSGINGSNVGRWALGDPQPTNGGTVQTGDDHTPSPGVNAWITGLSENGSVGGNDVDGGATILTSPTFNTVGMTSPRVSYWRWYVSGIATNPSTDFWTVELSTNAGGSWFPIENTDVSTPAWLNIDLPIPISGLTQFRYTARDTGDGSITEAGLDDFMIYDVTTQPTDAPLVSSGGSLRLEAARPNPFRFGDSVTLSFVLPSAGPVSVRVVDVAGRRVADLLDETLAAGSHRVAWDGRGDGGNPAPSGVYFIAVRTRDGEVSRRALFVR